MSVGEVSQREKRTGDLHGEVLVLLWGDKCKWVPDLEPHPHLSVSGEG